MKHTILLLALLTGAPVALTRIAVAQDSTHAPAMLTPAQRLEKRLDHAANRLKLTDQQRDQLKSIWQQNDSKLAADRAAIQAAAPGSDARKAARAQLATDQGAMDQQMKSVLTPVQLRKFKRMMIRDIDRRERRLQHEKQLLKQ